MTENLKEVLKKGFDPQVRSELLDATKKRVESGDLFPVKKSDVDKSFAPRMNRSSRRRVVASDLERIAAKI